jgi:putative spermidine/putrescine transport system permease protein
MSKKILSWRVPVLASFIVFMTIPIIATGIFSISTRWDRTLWPEGLTLNWWLKVTARSAFFDTLLNSFWVATLTVAVSLAIIVPAAFLVHTRVNRAKPLLEFLSIAPFSMPGVVFAVSLLRLYSMVPLPIVNTPNILVAAYVTITLPFMYRPVMNALESINIKNLTEAAEILGANSFQTFLLIVIPNITRGIISGSLLVFSAVFAEFVLANLLIGTRFKTFPIYLVEFTRLDARQASALAMMSFAIAWLITLGVLWILAGNNKISAREHHSKT